VLGYVRAAEAPSSEAPVVYARAAAKPVQLTYTVRPGDTLSSIARATCGSASDWPGLWEQNKAEVRNPDEIRAGEVLVIDPVHGVTLKVIDAAYDAIPAPPKIVLTSDRSLSSTSGSGTWSPPGGAVDPQAAPVMAGTAAGGIPGGSFGQCVVARESGGNAQVMNASGHYGLFQFSASTWADYGGDPADFGNATPAQQIAVFANAMASPGGESNWAPYDGC
jgi:hypothetical protein